MPDPDLPIHASGEMRVSDFPLRQIAYAGLYVTETLWQDFRRGVLLKAIPACQKRDGRFGGLGQASAPWAISPAGALEAQRVRRAPPN